MNLPAEYLLLRQPGRKAEVVHVKPNGEELLFTGKRWDARAVFLQCRRKHPELPAYVRKIKGTIVKAEGDSL